MVSGGGVMAWSLLTVAWFIVDRCSNVGSNVDTMLGTLLQPSVVWWLRPPALPIPP